MKRRLTKNSSSRVFFFFSYEIAKTLKYKHSRSFLHNALEDKQGVDASGKLGGTSSNPKLILAKVEP